jgi:hypothetical protein
MKGNQKQFAATLVAWTLIGVTALVAQDKVVEAPGAGPPMSGKRRAPRPMIRSSSK